MFLFFSDCCCVKWGGLKPHIEWVNVPVCYHPSKYYCSHVLHAYVSIIHSIKISCGTSSTAYRLYTQSLWQCFIQTQFDHVQG